VALSRSGSGAVRAAAAAGEGGRRHSARDLAALRTVSVEALKRLADR
jgi:hypothetical protein